MKLKQCLQNLENNVDDLMEGFYWDLWNLTSTQVNIHH